jgi:hypothetical protein
MEMARNNVKDDQAGGTKMERMELEKQLAGLESVNDQLVTELTYVDELMRAIGFSRGLVSVKAVAEELIRERVEQQEGC